MLVVAEAVHTKAVLVELAVVAAVEMLVRLVVIMRELRGRSIPEAVAAVHQETLVLRQVGLLVVLVDQAL
jgi:hypothetical protein